MKSRLEKSETTTFVANWLEFINSSVVAGFLYCLCWLWAIFTSVYRRRLRHCRTMS